TFKSRRVIIIGIIGKKFKLFFISRRRRHTRSKRDWSSDVCSSDLDRPATARGCAGGIERSGGPGCCSCGSQPGGACAHAQERLSGEAGTGRDGKRHERSSSSNCSGRW